VLWGTWFFTAAAYFSVAEGGHRYYTVMLAPAIAALVGAGVGFLWRDYRSPGKRGWALPLALAGTAVVQAYVLLVGYEDWSHRLTPGILGLCLAAAVVLVVLRLRRTRSTAGAYPAVAAAVGVAALLVAPAVWAAYTVWQGNSGPLPSAGPRPTLAFAGGPPGGGSPLGGGPPGGGFFGRGAASPALVEYLRAERGDAEYLVAATNAMSLSPLILSTEEPVISIGGYNGVDPVFTADELAELVDEGSLRFFLMPDRDRIEEIRAEREQSGQQPGGPPGAPQGGPPGGPMSALPQNGSAEWVEESCEQVPQELWQPSDSEQQRGPVRIQALYDCGPGGG